MTSTVSASGVSRETLSDAPVAPNLPVLAARNVCISYGTRQAVASVSLSLERCGLHALIGPNGSGKSSLLRCLAGVTVPDSGSVLLGGSSLSRLSAAEAARKIAYVPQHNPMPFAFTVEELVSLSGATPERREFALETMDLQTLRQRSVVTLSGGERQRAAIARALAQDSPILLLDEPTAHLDLRHQLLLIRSLHDAIRQGQRTALLVLHDLALAARYMDYLYLLAEGKLLAEGTPIEVLTEGHLEQAYGVPITIQTDESGKKPLISLPNL
ncbi:MAG: Fe(3+) dicitrate ABC transporter ATP-binding protein FecE [Armatimonadaceae bacterium]